MNDEERAALYRTQRRECRANLIAAERAMAGSTSARAALEVTWSPISLWMLERDMADEECWRPLDAVIENRSCVGVPHTLQ